MIAQLPPWLQPANPVPYFLQGMQIGQQQAEAQAQRAQQIRIAELAAHRQEQEAAQQQARWETEMQLTNAETARRVQAQLHYRDLVQGGMDPTQAMMLTPEIWGNSLSGVAQVARAAKLEDQDRNFVPRMINLGKNEFAEVSPGHYQLIRPPEDYTAQSVIDSEGQDTGWMRSGRRYIAQVKEGQMTAQESARLRALTSERAGLMKRYQFYLDPMLGEKLLSKANPAVRKTIEDAIARLAEIEQQIKELTGEPEVTAETPPPTAPAVAPSNLKTGVRSSKRIS